MEVGGGVEEELGAELELAVVVVTGAAQSMLWLVPTIGLKVLDKLEDELELEVVVVGFPWVTLF